MSRLYLLVLYKIINVKNKFMEKNAVEVAKKILEDEVENASYTYANPFGNAGSYRKLMDYLYANIMDDSVGREHAKDWLFELYSNQEEKDQKVFQDRVDVVITAIEYLKNKGKLI